MDRIPTASPASAITVAVSGGGAWASAVVQNNEVDGWGVSSNSVAMTVQNVITGKGIVSGNTVHSPGASVAAR